jgi:hypothetical protein
MRDKLVQLINAGATNDPNDIDYDAAIKDFYSVVRCDNCKHWKREPESRRCGYCMSTDNTVEFSADDDLCKRFEEK